MGYRLSTIEMLRAAKKALTLKKYENPLPIPGSDKLSTVR
jgi:hypothetical protein